MLRFFRKFNVKNLPSSVYFIQSKTFLTNDYKCTSAWNAQTSSELLTKINLNDFYNAIDMKHSSKGVISAIDVDIFANALKDPVYLEELKDLLHKLRLSAETGNTLDSTHHATIRNYIEFGQIQDLLAILKDPLNFGVFLDDYTANILLDKLITSEQFELAANVASLVMLQENYPNDITNTLSQYACFKYISSYVPPEPEPPAPKPKKVEEIKIRIKFLRNEYFDDHFDIKDTYTLSGKTLAWISEQGSDNTNNNLQIIGWLVYKKYDKLLAACENVAKVTSTKVYAEVKELIQKELKNVEEDTKQLLETCISSLEKASPAETSLEESIKTQIENAINKAQSKDIAAQNQLFSSWVKVREEKLEEQIKRLDRAKRTQEIEEQQQQLEQEEQKLWFFENEEKIDLEIEELEKSLEEPTTKKAASKKTDENYIPPEILRKRK